MNGIDPGPDDVAGRVPPRGRHEGYLERIGRGGFATRLVLIAVLCGLAQIPLWSVADLVQERMAGREQAVGEVERGWGGSRQFYLPYLDLPVTVTSTAHDSSRVPGRRHFGLIAERAELDLHMEPELRRRGLFDVVLYRSGFDFKGGYAVPTAAEVAEAFGVAVGDIVIDWQGAQLVLDVAAPQSLEGDVTITQGTDARVMTLEPSHTGLNGPRDTARLVAPVDVQPGMLARFSLAMVARGSHDTMIVPGAGQIEVALSSPWASPSFLGARLPVQRDVTDAGFQARWSQAGSNLAVPAWSIVGSPSSAAAARDAEFGLRLLQPVDTYRMVERAVKYGMLFVVTTFFVYVMFEATGGVAVHIVHYGLVALALCLFYLLLLSLAEVWGFGPAYLASCIAVLAQTGLFTRAIAGGWRRMMAFVGVLGAAYGWLYVLLDMQDFALLGGALGLFVLLSVAMYVLRRLGSPGLAPAIPAAQ